MLTTVGGARLHCGHWQDVLPRLPGASVDLVLTDPPYPCIKRPYGCMSEAEWHAMMRALVPEVRRLLKPSGSAVFVLQPNSERVGRMRTWLWEFMAWVGREWGIVQDAWWWNPSTPPTVHCHRGRGGMRPSVKACVWAGPADCYKSQDRVLLEAAEATVSDKRLNRFELHRYPGGQSVRMGRALGTFRERGGVTPFNLLIHSNGDSQSSAGAHGHGAGTPAKLCDWWLRYLCPPGGRVLDPFSGSGTVALSALRQGKEAVGVEKMPEYHATAGKRLREAAPLFAEVPRAD